MSASPGTPRTGGSTGSQGITGSIGICGCAGWPRPPPGDQGVRTLMALPTRPAMTMRHVVRKLAGAAPHELRAAVQLLPVEPDVVLYESFAGNGMLCNPEAIFRALLADPEQQHLRHVWVLADLKAYASTVAEFAAGPARAVRAAGVAGLPPGAGDRGAARQQRDVPAALGQAAGPDLPQHVARHAPQGDGLRRGAGSVGSAQRAAQLHDGRLPALDGRVHVGADVRARLPPRQHRPGRARRGRLPAHRPAVRRRRDSASAPAPGCGRRAWCSPTTRPSSCSPPRGRESRSTRRATTPPSSSRSSTSWSSCCLPAHRVLLKVHQQVYGFAAAEPRLAGRLVPNHLPTNAVLGVTDVLVTDYSSIFFDFLATGRPDRSSTRPTARSTTATAAATWLSRSCPDRRCGSARELAAVVAAVGTGTGGRPRGDPRRRVCRRARPVRSPRRRRGDPDASSTSSCAAERDGHCGATHPARRPRTLMLYLGGHDVQRHHELGAQPAAHARPLRGGTSRS